MTLSRQKALTSRALWTESSDDPREFEKKTGKKDIHSAGYSWPNDLTFHTKPQYASDIVTWTTRGNILIPEINLEQVQDVHFLDQGIKVSEGNPNVVISYSRFTILWRTMMEKVYDFENPYATSKKIGEVGSLLAAILHIANSLCT